MDEPGAWMLNLWHHSFSIQVFNLLVYHATLLRASSGFPQSLLVSLVTSCDFPTAFLLLF
jgi:hypothetical protein